MKDSVSLLMYHAVSQPHTRCDDADQYLSVGKESFQQQITGIIGLGHSICCLQNALENDSVKLGCKTVFTFDDGHISNYQAALPILVDNSATADFFINPGNVGKQNFINWAELREMAGVGMSIQSHGYRHVYLTSLTDSRLRENLLRSRLEIEENVGTKVNILAPPGGRMDKRVVRIAQDVGYKYIVNSQAGRWHPQADPFNVPRFTVARSTTQDKVIGWASGRIWPVYISSTKYWVSYYAKKMLGDETYDHLRKLVLGSHSKK